MLSSFPLRSKSAVEVASTTEERVLGYFGVPEFFRSDNRREFVYQVLQALCGSGNVDTHHG